MADSSTCKILVLFTFAALLIPGCVQQEACNKPYILVGKNCCLDRNNNSVCDSDEAPEERAPTRAAGMVVLSEPGGRSFEPFDDVTKEESADAENTSSYIEDAVLKVRMRFVYADESNVSVARVLVDGLDLGVGSGGVFELENLSLGIHRLVVYADSRTYSLEYQYGGGDAVVVLDPVITVEGTVYSKAGDPLQGVDVYFDGEHAARTDSSGFFGFSAKAGSHRLVLQGPGIYEEGLYEFYSPRVRMSFSLLRRYSVELTVTDSVSGDYVSGARVYLDGVPCNRTDADGTIILENVSEGAHVVEVYYGGVFARRSITVSHDRQNLEIPIGLPRNVTLLVADRLTGEPVAGAQVFLEGREAGATGPYGTILLHDVHPGECDLRISYMGLSERYGVDFSNDEYATVEIDVPFNATLSITDTETSKPVAGWDLLLKAADSAMAYKTRTDAAGRALVPGMVAGTYHLELRDSQVLEDYFRSADAISVAGPGILSVALDMPNPRYAGLISCSEYGVFNKMGRCNVSVENRNYQGAVKSVGATLFLFVLSGDGTKDALRVAGAHSKQLGDITPGETISVFFDPLQEFEGAKEETVVALLMDRWPYSPENKKIMGRYAVSDSAIERMLALIKEYCREASNECAGVYSGAVAWILVWAP